MLTTFHVKGASREAVEALVESQLASEGYLLAPEAEGTSDRLSTTVREIFVREEGGWIGLTDHPFADTKWGEVLAPALASSVLELSGECDHAFYSRAVLHGTDGEEGESEVPRDAVLHDDGRHRIRPTFLAALVPSAATALDAGIAIHDLGGEENNFALGRVLGIPESVLDPRPQYGEEPAKANLARLVFRRDPDAPVKSSNFFGEDVLAKMMTELATAFGTSLEGAGMPVTAEGLPDIQTLLAEAEDMPVESHFTQLTVRSGIEGNDVGGFVVTVSLGSTVAKARGVELEIHGDALRLLAPLRVLEGTVSGKRHRAKAVTSEGRHVFRFPALELQVDRPLKPSALRGSFNMGAIAAFGATEEAASVSFDFLSPLLRAGKGELTVTTRLLEVEPAPEQRAELIERVSARTESLEVRARPRLPVLPAFVVRERLQASTVESYGGRSQLSGWIGFERPWPEVSRWVVPIVDDLLAALRASTGLAIAEARVMTSANESLSFRALGRQEWTRVDAELSRGANVSMLGYEDRNCDEESDEPMQMATLELQHRLPEDNAYGEPLDEVRVAIAWTLRPPKKDDARARIAEVSQEVVFAAGHAIGNVGGFFMASGSSPGMRPTPYENLLGHRWLKQTWCASHVRTPAWCILAPPKAAARLDARAASPRIWTSRTTHGLFIRSRAADPIAYEAADVEAMERFVLPAMGTKGEIADLPE